MERKGVGAPGVDGQSMRSVEADLTNQRFMIQPWRSSDRSVAPSILRVRSKTEGCVRQLGIPIIGDRIAQAVVTPYLVLCEELASHEDFDGFRPDGVRPRMRERQLPNEY